MDLTQERIASMRYQLLVCGFSIFCIVYLVGCLLWKFVQGDKYTSVPGSSLDQAETGGLKKQKNMSDEEIFQLEKRAFFSKVGRLEFCTESPKEGEN